MKTADDSEPGGMAQWAHNMAPADAVQAVSGNRVRSTSGAHSTNETSRSCSVVTELW
jgi:hypothetical protein